MAHASTEVLPKAGFALQNAFEAPRIQVHKFRVSRSKLWDFPTPTFSLHDTAFSAERAGELPNQVEMQGKLECRQIRVFKTAEEVKRSFHNFAQTLDRSVFWMLCHLFATQAC